MASKIDPWCQKSENKHADFPHDRAPLSSRHHGNYCAVGPKALLKEHCFGSVWSNIYIYIYTYIYIYIYIIRTRLSNTNEHGRAPVQGSSPAEKPPSRRFCLCSAKHVRVRQACSHSANLFVFDKHVSIHQNNI